MRSSKRRKGAGGAIAWQDGGDAEGNDGMDENISSSDSEGEEAAKVKAAPPAETEMEARVRLAKEYIAQLMEEEASDGASSDGESDGGAADDLGDAPAATDRVSDRLARDANRLAGHVFQSVADHLVGVGRLHGRYLVDRDCDGHQLPLTCVALASDGLSVFSGSKDCCVVRWNVRTGKQLARYDGARPLSAARGHNRRAKAAAAAAAAAAALPSGEAAAAEAAAAEAAATEANVVEVEVASAASGEAGAAVAIYGGDGDEAEEEEEGVALFGHTGHVLSIAVSSDGRRVATGGRDNAVRIWNSTTDTYVDAFTAHRDAVSGVAFREHTHTLFSASFDRSVMIWNVDEMSYVDTLYGHQSPINAVASGVKERAVTVGVDSTMRVWKVVDESQLVFRGKGSLDCVAMVDEQYFLSGDDRGTLSLWSTAKKKAIARVEFAHGEESGVGGRWITAVAMLRGTDLVATGSSDGQVRFWKVDGPKKRIDAVEGVECPVVGFVNGLEFEKRGRFLVIAVGQEHRLGRWWHVDGAYNGVRCVRLPSAAWIE